MAKRFYVVTADFPKAGCQLFVDVECSYGDKDVVLVKAKRIVREEFGEGVVEAAGDWTVEEKKSHQSTQK